MGKDTLTVQSFTLYSSKGIRLQGEVKTLDDGKPHPVIIVSHGFRGYKDWAFWPEVTSRLAEASMRSATISPVLLPGKTAWRKRRLQPHQPSPRSLKIWRRCFERY
ncbi:hypothetical protein [Paenibacillus glycanilyticus]|uniref:hypothetical protein n=1 Tax=Paenibacillus glycanilyticus TaxID=126569 RepID=UPI003EB8E969